LIPGIDPLERNKPDAGKREDVEEEKNSRAVRKKITAVLLHSSSSTSGWLLTSLIERPSSHHPHLLFRDR